MNHIAFIPIRSGSKRIKDKNIKLLNSKPLCYYVINTAIKSKIFNKVIINSDSKEYLDIVISLFKDKNIKSSLLEYELRPPELAQDDTKTDDVILKSISDNTIPTGTDYIWLLQVTSPFTNTDHLDECNKILNIIKYTSIISGYSIHNFIWTKNQFHIYKPNYNVNARPFTTDIKTNYIVENGAFYITDYEYFKEYKNRISYRNYYLYTMNGLGVNIDIDTMDDFRLAEELMTLQG